MDNFDNVLLIKNYIRKKYNKHISNSENPRYPNVNLDTISKYITERFKNSKDLINDKNYFTVQIPISKNRIDIDNELEKLRTIHNIQKSEKKTNISFHRPVKHKEMKRMFDVFKLKEQTKLKNEEIALKVKYKTGTYTKQGKTYQKKDVYIMKGTQQVQQGGVRQVQNAYASAKKLIINIAKGDFPKNKL